MKVILIIFLLLVSIRAIAPPTIEHTPEPVTKEVDPFEDLIYAIGMVECSLDTMAINAFEQAYGYFQVRQIRLDDYHKRTGILYTLQDMLIYEKAEQVFRYYAEKIGPDDLCLIARSWNGSGPMTWEYWGKVSAYLD